MEQLIELSPTEIKLAFVASCIEGLHVGSANPIKKYTLE